MSDADLTDNRTSGEFPSFESQEWVIPTLVPEPYAAEEPAPRAVRKPRVVLPAVLFLATCASTYFVGYLEYGPRAWMYAVPLMLILVCHEAGHFVQTRRYHVPASYPFFIPIPIPPIGTMGAVIGMSPDIPDRRALFDIGISGPLAGLVPTMICVFLGLQWSHIVPASPTPGVDVVGFPPLLNFLVSHEFGAIPRGFALELSPVLHAGWVGLLITSLNLFPIGQLDGGHVLFALLKKRAHSVATLLLFAAVGFVVAIPALRPWTLMLVLLMFMGPKHPPTRDDHVSLGTWRVVLGWLTLAFLPLGFTPIPFPGVW